MQCGGFLGVLGQDEGSGNLAQDGISFLLAPDIPEPRSWGACSRTGGAGRTSEGPFEPVSSLQERPLGEPVELSVGTYDLGLNWRSKGPPLGSR